MENDEDFLAAVEADNIGAPVEEPKPEPPVEEPKQEEPPQADPPVLELTQTIPDTPKPEPGFVPIVAMLDARDRAKAAEAELARLREQQQQAPVQRPDPYEDPEGFSAWQEAQTAAAVYQTRLEFSDQIASIKHGEETVKAAKEWGFNKCNEDPYFNAKVAASRDPIGYVVAEYKREEIASKVTPDEFAQFQAWKTAQQQLQTTQPAPAAAPQQTSAIPPPSLASAPSAGSILTEPVQSDEDIFKEVLPKR